MLGGKYQPMSFLENKYKMGRNKKGRNKEEERNKK
jgi:hypothetical protein